MSVACLSKVSVAELCGVDNHEEMCTVYDNDQSETQKYVCKIGLEHNDMCGKFVQVRAEE
jgi:hypothetical protein